jgi:hypothetical protein
LSLTECPRNCAKLNLCNFRSIFFCSIINQVEQEATQWKSNRSWPQIATV